MPAQTIYDAPRVNTPIAIHGESKQPDYQTAQNRYPDQYETDIPEYLRYAVNPDQSSLAPKERIEQNHAQLAALTTAVFKFGGSIWDAIRTWGTFGIRPTATEQAEQLASKLVPYDRSQPGYGLLQTTADLAVDTLGFFSYRWNGFYEQRWHEHGNYRADTR